jgi:hypothetical protein
MHAGSAREEDQGTIDATEKFRMPKRAWPVPETRRRTRRNAQDYRRRQRDIDALNAEEKAKARDEFKPKRRAKREIALAKDAAVANCVSAIGADRRHRDSDREKK